MKIKFFDAKAYRREILILAFLLVSAGFLALFSLKAFSPKPGLKVSPSQNFTVQPTPTVVLPNQTFPVQTSPVQTVINCGIEERLLKVRGDSLAGLVEDGAVLKILMGYYQCHPVERGDLVVYDYPGGDPLIKIAKGISGDKFQLKKSAAGDCWNILINDAIIKNAQNQPHCVGSQGYRMLSLYEKDYKGVIPADALLILGNSTGGSLDSTRFGLVGQSDLLGKAVK